MKQISRSTIYIALTAFLFLCPLLAQIPSGFVQTTATVPSLANGTYGASWTNLSSSSQLGLLGCVSTFQTTVNGAIDSNGYFSTLLADTAQICPTPSTWTFTLTFACPGSASSGAFQVAVPVTGGGGTEDITSQITAALPANPCAASGGLVSYPSAVQGAIPIVSQAYPIVKLGNSGIIQTGTPGTNSQVDAFPGAITAPSVNGVINVASYLTAGDIGQAFAAAYAAKGQTEYYIPAPPASPGYYTYSHTITFPSIDSGTITLRCAPGTQLVYTGSSDAFQVLGTGQSKLGHILEGCHFNGTAAAVSGIHLRAVNGATISDVRVEGFTGGDGVLNQGANTIEYDNALLQGNKNNVHNVGVVVSAVDYSANAIHFVGGLNGNASQWGVFEDASLSPSTGPNQNNTYENIAFEVNGATASYGQAFVQACQGCVFSKDYFEYNQAMTNQILAGDSVYQAVGLIVRDNYLNAFGGTLTNAVNCVNCYQADIATNTDVTGTETNFVNNGVLSAWTNVENNGTQATNYTTGSGTFGTINHAGLVTLGENLVVRGSLQGLGDIINVRAIVVPYASLGYQGPAAGYVQLAPAPSGAGCLYQDGSGTYSWAACSGGIADITISIASFAIPATTCYGSSGSTTPATASWTGLTTAMGVTPTYTGNASAITGWGAVGGLNVMAWPSAAGTASYLVCNPTSGSITGGAITFMLVAK